MLLTALPSLLRTSPVVLSPKRTTSTPAVPPSPLHMPLPFSPTFRTIHVPSTKVEVARLSPCRDLDMRTTRRAVILTVTKAYASLNHTTTTVTVTAFSEWQRACARAWKGVLMFSMHSSSSMLKPVITISISQQPAFLSAGIVFSFFFFGIALHLFYHSFLQML